jgi:uncharacterized membrane protein (DUF373 family)
MADNYDIQIALLIKYMKVVPVIVYIVVALFLSIAMIISLGITLSEIIELIKTPNTDIGIIQIIYSILLTVIIIELFETVIVYLRTRRVPVIAILIAGLTAMIRHVIIYNVNNAENAEPMIIIGPAMVLAVLIAGIYLLREDTSSGNSTIIPPFSDRVSELEKTD